MAISTSRVTAIVLELRDSLGTTTINKTQLDTLLAGGGGGSSGGGGSTTVQFTPTEVTNLRQYTAKNFTEDNLTLLKAFFDSGITSQQIAALKSLAEVLTQTSGGDSPALTGLKALAQQNFTTDEATTLKSLSQSSTLKTFVTASSNGSRIMTSDTVSGVEQVELIPQTQKEDTIYILVEQPAAAAAISSIAAASLPVTNFIEHPELNQANDAPSEVDTGVLTPDDKPVISLAAADTAVKVAAVPTEKTSPSTATTTSTGSTTKKRTRKATTS